MFRLTSDNSHADDTTDYDSLLKSEVTATVRGTYCQPKSD